MIHVRGSTRRILFVSLVLAVVLLTLFRWTHLNADYLRNTPIDSPIRPPAQNPTHPSPRPPPSSNPNPEQEKQPESNDFGTKEAWIKVAVDTELAGPIKHAPIQSVCASSKWREDLVFTCDHIAGGIGNVRNHLLNCIRYSIEGGGSLVMPGIIRRKAEDISDIYTDEWQDLSYLLDKSWFAEQLAEGCPELKVWDKLEDVPGYNDGKVTATANLLPGSLDNWVPKTGLAHPEFWRGWFDKWLVEYVGDKPEGSTAHVGLGRAYLEYPIHHDGEDFVREFGKIIRLREDARIISATVLWELKEKFFKEGGIDPEKEVNDGAYFGVHLRTEADAVKAWPAEDWKYQRYDVQAELSIEEIKNSNLAVVYVASGNVTEVERLESDLHTALNTTSISVVTKHDLLTGDDKKMLEGMTFDQQALIDLLIMEKASKFVGIGHSSFAWNVALKRHLLVPKEKEFLDGQFMLSDSLSQIFGVPRAYPEYASCMWP